MLPIRRLLLASSILGLGMVAPAGLQPSRAAEHQSIRLPVAATVDVASRFAAQRVVLTGWIEVGKSESRTELGLMVSDLTVSDVQLRGASQLGVINVTERADDGDLYVSSGQVRALQAGEAFPASSYIDLYADISAPESQIGPITIHNEGPLHLVAWQGTTEAGIASWPPLAATYRLAPILDFDNDGDGATDEDTADEDGDVFIDEDRPGIDPETPGLPQQCGNDADCDGQDGEDPPALGCGVSCDDDADGATDEDPSCLPLFNEGNTSLPLGVCVTGLQVGIAPGTPSFSVAIDGPSRNHPADILGLAPAEGSSAFLAPYVRIACSALGLTADGCDDGSDGTQDDIDGLSYGLDGLEGAGALFAFSVGPGALGASGSAVEAQRNCPPAAPGLAPEADGDIFTTSGNGKNELLFDGNGPVGTCAQAFPLGLVEGATARDDVDALEADDTSEVDRDGDGVPEFPLYFSLSAGSPSLAALGFSAGDILVTVHGALPVRYASREELGLSGGDDLDDFCLREAGTPIYTSADLVYYSLAPRLQGPASKDVGPADILAPDQPAVVVLHADELGLSSADDLDALECQMLGALTEASGDVTCDGATDAVDALYVLKFNAELLSTLPCAANGDMSGDGRTNSLDALLILQYAAGLLGATR